MHYVQSPTSNEEIRGKYKKVIIHFNIFWNVLATVSAVGVSIRYLQIGSDFQPPWTFVWSRLNVVVECPRHP